MARYSGIYLNLEGTTVDIDSLQQPRETAWDTTSGMFRYMDAASGIHYLGGESLWSDVGGGSGIYYPITDTKKIYFGHPTGSYMSLEQWSISPSANTLGFSSLYLCGSEFEYRTSTINRVFTASSGLFQVNVNVGIGGAPDATAKLKVTGNTMMSGETIFNSINSVGDGGTSGSPVSIVTNGYSIIAVNPSGEPKYYSLSAGSDGQLLHLFNVSPSYVVYFKSPSNIIGPQVGATCWWDSTTSTWLLVKGIT